MAALRYTSGSGRSSSDFWVLPNRWRQYFYFTRCAACCSASIISLNPPILLTAAHCSGCSGAVQIGCNNPFSTVTASATATYHYALHSWWSHHVLSVDRSVCDGMVPVLRSYVVDCVWCCLFLLSLCRWCVSDCSIHSEPELWLTHSVFQWHCCGALAVSHHYGWSTSCRHSLSVKLHWCQWHAILRIRFVWRHAAKYSEHETEHRKCQSHGIWNHSDGNHSHFLANGNVDGVGKSAVPRHHGVPCSITFNALCSWPMSILWANRAALGPGTYIDNTMICIRGILCRQNGPATRL